MPEKRPRDVLIFRAESAMMRHVADRIASCARAAVDARGRFLMSLSGGGTPKPLYRLLATAPYATKMPWEATHLLWGDERMVHPHDSGSNYWQAQQAFINRVAIPEGNVHRILGELAPEQAAIDYAGKLRALAESGRLWPRLDLALLGMGSDGHTASLFPGLPDQAEERKPTLAVTADYDGRPAHRVTLTPAVFNDARLLLFLVTGKSKARMVARVLEPGAESDPTLPVSRLTPTSGQIVWILDAAAAAELEDISAVRCG